DPVLTLSAPYSTRLERLPVMGTSACSPTGDQQARKGGVSVTMVASENSATVRRHPLSPRWSPLWPGASAGRAATARSAAASSGSPAAAAPAGWWPPTPRRPAAGGGAATAVSSRPGGGSRAGAGQSAGPLGATSRLLH